VLIITNYKKFHVNSIKHLNIILFALLQKETIYINHNIFWYTNRRQRESV